MVGKPDIFSIVARGVPRCSFLNALIRCSFILLIFLISFYANSQSRWRSYVGTYFTGDAQMVYTGPSILLGSDFLINKNVSAGLYGHHFKRTLADEDNFQTWTLAVLGQVNLGKGKKIYLAMGVAWQRTIENYYNSFDVRNRSIIIPAYRVGYHFVFKKFVLSPEMILTGPYSYNQTTELLTLPSIGARFHFVRKPRKRNYK